jgi:hypothetical protein
MASNEGRYGLTSNEIKAARERWRNIGKDSEFDGGFEGYLKWMVKSGWKKGMHIAKIDESKPHSETNSTWVNCLGEKPVCQPEAEDEYSNPFCDRCQKKGTDDCDGYGCGEWRAWFRDNWDSHILKRTDPARKREVWRYPHPDDIREGRA